MSKELELFRQIIKGYTEMFNMAIHHPKDTIVKWEGVEEIEKSLKALEIIRNKKVDVGYLVNLMVKCNNDEKVIQTYNTMNVWTYACGGKGFITDKTTDITQGEYDLLKEVLL